MIGSKISRRTRRPSHHRLPSSPAEVSRVLDLSNLLFQNAQNHRRRRRPLLRLHRALRSLPPLALHLGHGRVRVGPRHLLRRRAADPAPPFLGPFSRRRGGRQHAQSLGQSRVDGRVLGRPDLRGPSAEEPHHGGDAAGHDGGPDRDSGHAPRPAGYRPPQPAARARVARPHRAWHRGAVAERRGQAGECANEEEGGGRGVRGCGPWPRRCARAASVRGRGPHLPSRRRAPHVALSLSLSPPAHRPSWRSPCSPPWCA